MRSVPAIAQFERRLIEMGCPSRRLQGKVRELADHYEDLKLAGLEDGLSESEAEERAVALLGDPVMLAENIVTGLRESSWWGRHPFIGFCLLPLPGIIILWLACGTALVGLCRLLGWIFGPAYYFDVKTVKELGADPASFHRLVAPFHRGFDAGVLLILTVACCLLARRSAAGLKWVLASCAACLLTSLFFFSGIESNNITLGLNWPPHFWANAMIPAAVALVAFLRQRNLESRLVAVPYDAERRRPVPPVKGSFLRRVCSTPTHWVVMVLTALILTWVGRQLVSSRREESRKAELKARVWPAERAATFALVQKGQRASVSARAKTVDLKRWLNTTLTASTDGPTNVVGNNLAGLPAGIHTYAGVPFDVEGRAQLLGQALLKSGKKFPGRIRGIAVGRKCDRLHLLHGASNLQTLDKKIASLVLHYENGSQEELWIVSGQHVLDWWGPIYNTDAGVGRNTSSPDTELAWAGENPWIKEQAPEFSLRLYKSTFVNPHPELEIASIDYISTLADAAPFLVGLTVEQSIN